MEEYSSADEARDLRQYLVVLQRRKKTLASVLVVVLALALAYSFIKKPVYTATATVVVPQEQPSSALNLSTSQLQSPTALQRVLSDAEQFAGGDAVKAAAQKALGFSAHVGIGTSTTSDVLTFTASSGASTEAPVIANAYANAYIAANRANQVKQYTDQVNALQQSIANLKMQETSLTPGSNQYVALQQSISTLTQTVEQTEAEAQLAGSVGPTIVNAATVPSSPSSPKPLRNGLLGVIAGLVLGIGVALLRERLDDGITSREVAERAAGGRPVVGLIPLVDSWLPKGSHHIALMEDPQSKAAEAYRTLRTAVQFVSIDQPRKVVALTSSVSGEGKTTCAANLAVSFARAGQQVILVSCDLRRPRLHEFFEVDNAVGLTSVLIGTALLSDALRPVPEEPYLRVLPSGPVPPNPAEILSLQQMADIVEELSTGADVVILDCPPVLPVTDALLISRLADGLLVLASTSRTSIAELRRTCELLGQTSVPILGVVLNRVPSDADRYGYGYGYYGTSNYESDRSAASNAGLTEPDRAPDSTQQNQERPLYRTDPQRMPAVELQPEDEVNAGPKSSSRRT